MFSAPSFNGFKIPHFSEVDPGYVFVGGFVNRDATAVNYIAKTSFTNTFDTTFFANSGTSPTNGFRGVTPVVYVGDIYKYKTGSNANKIICGGVFTTYASISRNNIARVLPNGKIDNTFTTESGFNSNVVGITVDEVTNKIYVVGLFTEYRGIAVNRICRLNNDGTLDSSFNIGTGFNGNTSSITQDDDHIYVGGNFSNYNGNGCSNIVKIEKLTGNLVSPSGGTNADVQYVKIDVNDPNYLFVTGNGNITNFNGTTCKQRFARVHKVTWTLDTSFNANISDFNDRVSYIDFTSTGNIIVSGSFTNYAGTGKNRLLQLNPDGTLNTTFNPTSPNLTLRSACYFPVNDKIGIFGPFEDYGTSVRDRVAIIDATTGAIDTNFNNSFYGGGNQDGWRGVEII